MELLLKKSIKILSCCEERSANVSELLNRLGGLVGIFGEDEFRKGLQNYRGINIANGIVRLDDELAKENNDERRLNLFFKEDKSNKSLYYLYRLILQAGVNGVNYSELAIQFNTKYVRGCHSGNRDIEDKKEKDIKKLDITNVSHYCRKLYALKFINILPEKVCKIAIATKFEDKSFQIDIRLKRRHVFEELDDPRKPQFSKLSIVNDPWKYLREDTFIVQELTFTQNILLNFASYDAYLKEGLLQTEIASKIHKLGERKMLVRSLESIIEDYKVHSTADRQGRTFSLKFHIKSPIMTQYIVIFFNYIHFQFQLALILLLS